MEQKLIITIMHGQQHIKKCKLVVGTSKTKRRLDVMMDPKQKEGFFVVLDTHPVVCYIYASNTSGAGIPACHWYQ